MELFTNCVVCLKRLSEPKTLNCLHSFCSTCLSRMIEDPLAPHKCPSCLEELNLTPSDLSHLEPNPFVTGLLTSLAQQSQLIKQRKLTPDINCEICEDKLAVAVCIECRQAFCQECQGSHLKMKSSAHHQYAPLGDRLRSGNSSSSSSEEAIMMSMPELRVCLCVEHGLEKNSYCVECKMPICSMCAIVSHSGHSFELLKDHTALLRASLLVQNQKVLDKESEVQKSLDLISSLIEELRANEKKAQQKLDMVFNEIYFQLENRKMVLSADLKEYYQLKETELLQQQSELQTIQSRLSFSSKFTHKLLNEGTPVEITLNKGKITQRLTQLMEKEVDLQPVHIASLEFVCEPMRPALTEAISHFGTIHHSIVNISNTMSRLEFNQKPVAKNNSKNKNNSNNNNTNNNNECVFEGIVNKGFNFVLVAADNEGRYVDNAAHLITLTVTGPNPNSEVEIKEEGNGRYTLCVTPTEIGTYHVTPKIKNQPLQNKTTRDFHLHISNKLYRDPHTFDEANAKHLSSPDAPADIIVNSQGELIVLGYHANHVQIYNRETGELLRQFGGSGAENGRFNNPQGLAVNSQDEILVADFNNHRIQIFDPSGTTHIRNLGTGISGAKDGEFNGPASVCVHHQRNGHILVADYHNHRIQIFDREGKFIRKFGCQGNGKGELSFPAGVVVNSRGEVIVSECGNHRVQIFDFKGNHLRFLSTDPNYFLNSPWHICLDDQDNVYIGSACKYPIDIVNTVTGKLVHSFANKGFFDAARGLHFDPKSNTLYVADFGANAVYGI